MGLSKGLVVSPKLLAYVDGFAREISSFFPGGIGIMFEDDLKAYAVAEMLKNSLCVPEELVRISYIGNSPNPCDFLPTQEAVSRELGYHDTVVMVVNHHASYLPEPWKLLFAEFEFEGHEIDFKELRSLADLALKAEP